MPPTHRCYTACRVYRNFSLRKPWSRWSTKNCLLNCLCLSIVFLSSFTVYTVTTLELWPWYPSVERWCERKSVPDSMLRQSADEITIVTMFLDLGTFKKGEQAFAYHSPYKYKRWMRTFGRLANRVVAYVETDGDVEYFRDIRSCLPSNMTKIIKIDRDQLPSFQHLPAIRAIYAQPSYPKHNPNTVYPEYTCAMHAKYDALEEACVSDYFKTPLVAWLDVGLFRRFDETDYEPFKLVPPVKFNPDKVAFSKVWSRSPEIHVESIMKENQVWLAGGMILATKQKMLEFTDAYRKAVVTLLDRGLSNTDQEVVYSMYTPEMRTANQIDVDAFSCQQGQFGLHGPDARYFCLAYLCKDTWHERWLARWDKERT